MSTRDTIAAVLKGFGSDKLSLVFSAVERLITLDAVHARSGDRLRTLTMTEIADHLEAEVRELRDGGGIEEAGDVLDILVHWCIRKGWTPAAVVNVALHKLALRFNIDRAHDDVVAAPTHVLKAWPEYFEVLASGEKPFDVRFDDRGYSIGDTIRFREWDLRNERYTGRELDAAITYVLRGMGVQPGHVALGLSFLNGDEHAVRIIQAMLLAEARHHLKAAV